MNKVTNKEIVDGMAKMAKKAGLVSLEKLSYQLNTTPAYLVQFGRVADAINGGELIFTYVRDEYDGHRKYVLFTKEKYDEWQAQGVEMGPRPSERF